MAALNVKSGVGPAHHSLPSFIHKEKGPFSCLYYSQGSSKVAWLMVKSCLFLPCLTCMQSTQFFFTWETPRVLVCNEGCGGELLRKWGRKWWSINPPPSSRSSCCVVLNVFSFPSRQSRGWNETRSTPFFLIISSKLMICLSGEVLTGRVNTGAPRGKISLWNCE